MNQDIKVNLYRDWVAHIKNELVQFGYEINLFENEKIVYVYLNLLKRLVSPEPRVIKKSNIFECPKEYIEALTEIENVITKGGDLTPYLSRLLRKQDYNDPLLNHWEIHHVHLSTNIENDGFVTRTGPLLYVRFDNENAYFINIYPHGSWCLQDMVATIHKNWPESIEQYLLKGILGSANSYTDKNIARLRKANVNTAVEINKTVVYAPLGGGQSTSGISTEVVMYSDYYKQKLRLMEESLIDNIDTIIKNAKEEKLIIPKILQFGLEMKENTVYAIEVNTMLAVKLGVL